MKTVPCNVIRRAVEEAQKSNADHFKHGGVIFKGRKIIASAPNVAFKTSPWGSGPHSTYHAEVAVILKARRTLGENMHGLKLFVARINRQGEIKNSKPCPDCYNMIMEYGLRPFWT